MESLSKIRENRLKTYNRSLSRSKSIQLLVNKRLILTRSELENQIKETWRNLGYNYSTIILPGKAISFIARIGFILNTYQENELKQELTRRVSPSYPLIKEFILSKYHFLKRSKELYEHYKVSNNLDNSNSPEPENSTKYTSNIISINPIKKTKLEDEEERPPSIDNYSSKIINQLKKSESVSKNINHFIDSAKVNIKFPILQKEILLNENDKIIEKQMNELMYKMIKNSNAINSLYPKLKSLESYQEHVRKKLADQYKKLDKKKLDTIEKLSILQPNGVEMHRVNYFLRDEITDISRGFAKRRKFIINDHYKKKLKELECEEREYDEKEDIEFENID